MALHHCQNNLHQWLFIIVALLWIFMQFLPRSLGVQFQNYLQQVLPAILDGKYAVIWEFFLCLKYLVCILSFEGF